MNRPNYSVGTHAVKQAKPEGNPLNILIRAASAGRFGKPLESAHLSLQRIRQQLLPDDALKEFELAAQRTGILDWLRPPVVSQFWVAISA